MAPSTLILYIKPKASRPIYKFSREDLRDWSSITGRGGGLKREGGGQVKFYPYKKGGGGETRFSHPEGGTHCKRFWVSFNTDA